MFTLQGNVLQYIMLQRTSKSSAILKIILSNSGQVVRVVTWDLNALSLGSIISFCTKVLVLSLLRIGTIRLLCSVLMAKT